MGPDSPTPNAHLAPGKSFNVGLKMSGSGGTITVLVDVNAWPRANQQVAVFAA
jgi:hypothetical protein